MAHRHKKIVVTGGSGFIGSAVCRYLVRDCGIAVCNVDKLTYAAIPDSLKIIEDHPLYTFEEGDVCDRARMDSVLATFQPDAVMHLAAESHVDRSIDRPADFLITNILGTSTMLDAVKTYWFNLSEDRKEQFRFHHISTDEVYGSLGTEGLFDETTPYDPHSPYSASKASSDHLVKAWFHTYGLPVVLTHCSNNYGPFQFPEKLIPLMILNALDGQPLPLYGKGDHIRDWLYVDDHAEALVMIIESGQLGETYNVGGRNERTNLDVVETVCDVLDKVRPRKVGAYRDLITFVDDRPGHDKRYAIDASKFENELGGRAKENFDSGIRKTIDWYLNNEAWWRPIREEKYAGHRLGKTTSES